MVSASGDNKTPASIDALRQRLDAIDASLIDLAAERQRLVSEIGRSKQKQGRQLRDFRREREVLDHVRARAKQQQLDPALAENLLKQLIDASLTRQEQERGRLSARGRDQRALVIGGAGRLGRWLADFLDNQGFDVVIADPACEADQAGQFSDWREAPLDVDMIVLATPIAVTVDLLRELTERGQSGLVLEVASVKSPLIAPLRAAAARGLSICSVHPMFGPDTRLLSGRHVLFMDVGCESAVARAEALFAETMAEIKRIDIEQHDRLIAWVLGLSHALNIAFFSALADSGLSSDELNAVSSTTFNRQLAIARDVAGENPDLYYEIQRLNQHGDQSRQALLDAIRSLIDQIDEHQPETFRAMMLKGRHYLRKPAD